MKILQLCPDFIGNRVFRDLFRQLGSMVDSQFVFVPVRNPLLQGRNGFESSSTRIVWSPCYSTLDRLLFFRKRDRVRVAVRACGGFDGVGLVHAHTLASAGSVAYEEWRATGIPYVVTVNNTDVNLFAKKALPLRPYLRRILEAAGAVIFLNPSLRDDLAACLGAEWSRRIEAKSHIVPLGVTDAWFRQGKPGGRAPGRPGVFRVLFVGRLDRNKNVLGLISAVDSLVRRGTTVELGVVGDGKYRKRVERFARRHSWLKSYGYVDDTPRLISIFDAHDCLALVSHRESFGLVYAEALARGLPIVYTRGQGIDGYIRDDGVGEPADSRAPGSIAGAITRAMAGREALSRGAAKVAERFGMESCARRHREIYEAARRGMPAGGARP